MPLYLRKNLTITPPSMSELGEVDDFNDFLQDPDQLRDILPQPYRMLDKILNSIYDNAWNIIASRENDRNAESSRIRPPQYPASIQIDGHGSSNCLCETDDGVYIIAGLPNGLGVIDALSQNVVDVWMQEDMSVTRLQVKILKEDQYLVCCSDEEGVARLFTVAGGKLYMLQSMNEAHSGGPKIMARKCEAAKDGSFIGIYFENTTTREGYLELHKSPLDTWMKELDAVVAKAASKAQMSSPQQQQQSEVEHSTSPSGGEVADGDADKTSGLQTPIDLSEKVAEPQETGVEARCNEKFTPTNLVIRVRPEGPIQPVMLTSPPQLAKDQGDVLGTGTGHLLSSQHLDGRHNWFSHHHQQYMKYLPSEEPPFREPNFHFLTPGRILAQGLENPVLAGSCTSVAVWWTDSHNLMFYSLIKSSKDEDDAATLGKSMKKAKRTVPGEIKDNDYADDLYRQRSKVSMTPFRPRAMSHRSTRSQASSIINDLSRYQEPKPDSVWPMAHAIVASTASPCSSLIALALANGSVIIWDKNLGMQRRVTHLTEDAGIEKVEFLDPSICPQELGNYPPYGTRTNAYLLATCNDSQMFLVECELGNGTAATQVTQAIENKDERYVDIKKVAGIPNMVIACRQDGLVYLINLLDGKVICEVSLPENYQLATPWKPVTAVGGLGQMIYIKASPKNSTNASDEKDSEADSQSKLFVFPLRQYNILNKHRIKERPSIPYTIHSTAQNRIDALLAERLSQQSMRKDRMQTRWGQMKGELELMIQIRKETATRVGNRDAYMGSSTEKIIEELHGTPHPMLMK